jgi:hypothetical protein
MLIFTIHDEKQFEKGVKIHRCNSMTNTKMVRISISLEEEFEKLPNKSDWNPTGFPEFVREAVRYYLRREVRRSRLEIEESEELDHLE